MFYTATPIEFLLNKYGNLLYIISIMLQPIRILKQTKTNLPIGYLDWSFSVVSVYLSV